MCNAESGAFCKSCTPYKSLGAVQVAGPAEHAAYDTQPIGESRFVNSIQRSTAPDLHVWAALRTRAQLQAA